MNPALGSFSLALFDVILTKLIDQGDGTWTAEADHLWDPGDASTNRPQGFKSGTVSCQPDGTIAWRPIGANEGYERFTRDDARGIAVFNPTGQKAIVKPWSAGVIGT